VNRIKSRTVCLLMFFTFKTGVGHKILFKSDFRHKISIIVNKSAFIHP
jgi:hypothetical protein